MTPKNLATLLLCVQTCLANVEKTIFLGPSTVNVPSQHPTLDDLRLHVLTPDECTLRTQIEAEFPNDDSPKGKASWFLLDHLKENQRYEVRICWPATQPTAFTLNTYELPEVWESSELLSSLNEYSLVRHERAVSDAEQTRTSRRRLEKPSKGEREASVLFLQVLAAADYYTTNATLMKDVPPVDVDIVLDPFILNVFPRSLVPTAIYIVVVAIASFFVARSVISWIQSILASGTTDEDKKRQ